MTRRRKDEEYTEFAEHLVRTGKQIEAKINEGDLPAAGQVYRKLKKLAPQSEEVIEARELIKAAVIKR